MGAGQSTGTAAAGKGQETKTSYYELLEISRQATEDEIKKAYRKKALQLHPDRNHGNEEAATKLFAEVQAAHEVLSDPQERAWYDSHESAILRGDDGGAGDGEAPVFKNGRLTTADDLARMIRKFNSKVEFTDEPSGFFGFIRQTFEQMALEEEVAAVMEGIEVRVYPGFGHKDDGYNDGVKHFYAAWSSFSTVKDFAWMDKYRLSEAPDRWYRRRMEQENNRLRQDGKREYNDAVRSLIAFVRKRDPRYEPNVQSEAERQQILRDAAAAQAARARAANAAKMEGNVPEWTKMREPDELEESEEEELVEEVFECVACNKVFKSEKQLEAHEKSKKHQKAVRSLQAKMRKENANLDLDADDDHTPDNGSVIDVAEDPTLHLDLKTSENISRSTNSADEEVLTQDEVVETTNADGNENDATDASSNPKDMTASEETRESHDDERDPDDEDYASPETIRTRMQSVTIEDTSSDDASKETKPKLGKAAQKRAKKAAAAAALEQDEAAPKCQMCNETFSSKTKLFRHIKDEGHAAIKTSDPHAKKPKKTRGKR